MRAQEDYGKLYKGVGTQGETQESLSVRYWMCLACLGGHDTDLEALKDYGKL